VRSMEPVDGWLQVGEVAQVVGAGVEAGQEVGQFGGAVADFGVGARVAAGGPANAGDLAGVGYHFVGQDDDRFPGHSVDRDPWRRLRRGWPVIWCWRGFVCGMGHGRDFDGQWLTRNPFNRDGSR
jgi:hypothetical protein